MLSAATNFASTSNAPRPSYATARLGYDLPQELIAQHPPTDRGTSRLIHVNVAEQRLTDCDFDFLPDLLPPHTLLVLNDSRVIPARVVGQRASGARVELLYHRYLGAGMIEAVIGSNARLPVGELLVLPGGWRGELLSEKSRDGSRVRLTDEQGRETGFEPTLSWLEAHGEVPLPPYIKRPAGARHSPPPAEDTARYQTVYAASAGSVAAPTAGLHFTGKMLTELQRRGHRLRYVTLHVGLGTFAPVRTADLAQHQMHREEFTLPDGLWAELEQQRKTANPVMAVGTTSLRALHSAGVQQSAAPPDGRAELPAKTLLQDATAFIYPGHGTHAADLLLTNFHLPGSTLLALVYAFGGEQLMRQVYTHAIASRYRFFSYGDCMLLDRRGAQLTSDGTVVEVSADRIDNNG
jgi:S-adenosylmethionine:tRNA ribosyltransferase-isomerase